MIVRSVLSILSLANVLMLTSCVSLSGTPGSLNRCPSAAPKQLVGAGHNTLHVEYQEPETQVNGMPLRTLSFTTIYYDLGSGAVEYAKHNATDVGGKGKVSRDIVIPISAGKQTEVRVCVTATNSVGEGAPSF